MIFHFLFVQIIPEEPAKENSFLSGEVVSVPSFHNISYWIYNLSFAFEVPAEDKDVVERRPKIGSVIWSLELSRNAFSISEFSCWCLFISIWSSFRDYNIITFLISTFILLEVEREEDIENKAVLEIPLRLDLKEKAHEEYSNLFNVRLSQGNSLFINFSILIIQLYIFITISIGDIPFSLCPNYSGRTSKREFIFIWRGG